METTDTNTKPHSFSTAIQKIVAALHADPDIALMSVQSLDIKDECFEAGAEVEAQITLQISIPPLIPAV